MMVAVALFAVALFVAVLVVRSTRFRSRIRMFEGRIWYVRFWPNPGIRIGGTSWSMARGRRPVRPLAQLGTIAKIEGRRSGIELNGDQIQDLYSQGVTTVDGIEVRWQRGQSRFVYTESD